MLDVLLVGAEELENLSTRYLAAVLRQHGYRVELAPFSTPDDAATVLRQAERTQPRVIGLSVIFQYRAPEFLALGSELRRRVPAAHITGGGHFFTFAAGELLRDYPILDSVVRGEGEYTLVELVQSLDKPNSWGTILGLSFRRDGSVVQNPPRPLIADLDSLPVPARDTPPQVHLGIGYSPILGSRGCYCDCSFCSIHSFYGSSRGRVQRFRSVSNVVDEMQMLYDRYGVRFFVFNDDEWFPAGPTRESRVAEFERELGRRKLQVIMSIKCRADDVEEDLFRRLLAMGVVRAYVGVESGSERSLRAFNKRTTVAQNRTALQVLNKVGMLADFGLIFFDPDSTPADVRANLDLLHEMAGAGQAPLSFGRMEVYAGTPILARLQREGRLTGDYMAWNYAIGDPCVELLFRLIIAAMRHRQYDNNGLAKQCSVACYEHMMYRYVRGDQSNPGFEAQMRQIVAGVNNDSLRVLEEMLAFVLREDVYNAELVNERAVAWASEVNLFDTRLGAELDDWRARLAGDVSRG